jgi:signal transduction histidine kinase
MRSLLDEPRAAPSPPDRVWRDWVLLAAVVIAALLEGLLRQDLPLRGLSTVLCVGLAPTLLWRRTHPLAMVAIAFGTSTVVDIVLVLADAPAIEMVSMIYFLLLPYALFRWGSGREVALGLPIILVAATTGLLVNWTGFGDLFGGSAVLLSSMMLGLVARVQHGARERQLAHIKAEERVQLARELHDTVAHHVSAIAIRAQAGRALAATDPAAPVEALEVIEAEASKSLAEMRAMVRMLRDQEPVDYTPQPGVADLERLAGGSPAGPRIEVTLSGDLAGLPAAVDGAVFRIAREAVTNALRHARHATRVDVRVERNGEAVHLNIRDDGDPTVNRPIAGTGFGLTGMVERAGLLGGTCLAGPCPDRGWAVDATLPLPVPR